jgi:hypothetical protein
VRADIADGKELIRDIENDDRLIAQINKRRSPFGSSEAGAISKNSTLDSSKVV